MNKKMTKQEFLNKFNATEDDIKTLAGEEALATVKKNGYELALVKEQTPEICLAAVNQDGYALQHVKQQTLEICLAAVKEYGLALKFVKEQTPEICLAAVEQNRDALNYVDLDVFDNDAGDLDVVINGVRYRPVKD